MTRSASPLRRSRSPILARAPAFYLAAIALVTAAYAVLSARVAQSWITGEWLINYQGGFVRRGLLGEMIFLAAQGLHRPPASIALLLPLLLYTAFYANVLLMTRRVRWTLPLIALFLSPATLSFIPLDPPSSVRKEVLLLLAITLTCLSLLLDRIRPVLLSLALAAAAGVCVLSHEGLVFYLPYLFAPVYLRWSSNARHALHRASDEPAAPGRAQWSRTATWICLPAVTVSLLSALASAMHPGSTATTAAICTLLGAVMQGEGHGFCGGAIAYLAHTPGYARQDLLRAAHAYHYGQLYSVTGALAVLPVLFCLRQLGRRRELSILLITTGTAALGSVVLFSLARDWGRWIAIHVTCLLLLLLFVDRLRSREELLPGSKEAGPLAGELPPARGWATISTPGRAAVLLGLLVYSTCWNLPGTGNYHARWGYLGLVSYLRSYRSSVHHSHSPALKPES